MAYYAFTDNNFQFTLENVQRFFTATSSVLQEDGSSAEVHTYLLIFWRSLKLAVISTVICLVLAYPLAYIMARAQAQNPEDFPDHHHDPHVDELPHPHLRLDDHFAGHGHF